MHTAEDGRQRGGVEDEDGSDNEDQGEAGEAYEDDTTQIAGDGDEDGTHK